VYSEKLEIAAFNIQVFGLSKMEKPGIAHHLVNILLRYDLVAVQEIRDQTETAFPALVKLLNENGGNFGSIVGPRLGRTNSKEQYGIIYNLDKLKITSSFTYDDTTNVFERPPLISMVQILSTKQKFTFISHHAKPGTEVTHLELDHLTKVYEAAKAKYRVNASWIVGDLNAACKFLPLYRWKDVSLHTDSRFKWVISNSTDTTSNYGGCAYDRMIGVGNVMDKYVAGSGGIFDFGKAYSLSAIEVANISDHFPVHVTMDLSTKQTKLSKPFGSTSPSSDSNNVGSILLVAGLCAAVVAFVAVVVVKVKQNKKPTSPLTEVLLKE
jgi:endonuclease/exonuclease/phosphatase family metal-dependent hydrolase